MAHHLWRLVVKARALRRLIDDLEREMETTVSTSRILGTWHHLNELTSELERVKAELDRTNAWPVSFGVDQRVVALR